jgi:FkbM family methyltransferase
MKSFKPLYGRGIGVRFPLALKAFLFFLRLFSGGLRPRIILVEVEGIKLYLDSKSTFAPGLMINRTYDKGTTKLFRDLIKEGMVILDIGANVGYYSLIAARLAGEKGLVFAFEPAPDNFAFLVKNIEVNGFSNIIPVQKAVSNKTGKGSLFLWDEPDLHSMREHNEKGAIEVEVTSVDEFMENINRPIDLVKMDVEGWEMRVLEGMPETIRRNPNLKIITEFSPHYLQKSGCSPAGFLEKLKDCGFKLYIIDEENETTKLADAGSIIKTPPRAAPNLYCDRQG